MLRAARSCRGAGLDPGSWLLSLVWKWGCSGHERGVPAPRPPRSLCINPPTHPHSGSTHRSCSLPSVPAPRSLIPPAESAASRLLRTCAQTPQVSFKHNHGSCASRLLPLLKTWQTEW